MMESFIYHHKIIMINSVGLIGLKLNKDMVKNTDKLHFLEINLMILIFIITTVIMDFKFQLTELIKEY